MDVSEVEKCLQYKNAEERDVLKQFFTNPQQIDRSKKTIIFSTPSETGTSFFRIFTPMLAMWEHFRDEANYIYCENLQPNHLRLADMIIMHRAGNLHSHFLSVVRLWPKTEIRPCIAHDVDDNEFNLPRTHPMSELWYSSGKDKMSIQSLKFSDFVMTTTEKLARTFKNFNSEVYVQRNMFNWKLPQWNYDKNEIRKQMIPEWCEGKIIIGWAGLTSHYEDIRRMHAILKPIHDKYPETVFILAGMALRDSQVEIEYGEDGQPHFKEKEIDDENMTYRARVKALYSDFDEDRIKTFDALPLEEYAKFYSLFDISLAYIEQNAFNSCKSEIKVIESLHYDCIPVFSEYGGYKDFWSSVPKDIRHSNMAIAMQSPKIWQRSLEYWIDKFKKNEHKEIISKIRKFSDYRYDINEHIEERLSFILDKCENHLEEQMNSTAKFKEYYGA